MRSQEYNHPTELEEPDIESSSNRFEDITRHLHTLSQRLKTRRIPFYFIAVIFVLILAKIAVLSVLLYMIQEDMIVYTGDLDNTSDLLLALGYQWDSHHFISIAENGYPSNADDPLLFAFAPLYPWTISTFNPLFGNYALTSVIISNSFYFLSIPAFFLAVREYMSYEQACCMSLLMGLFPTYLAYSTFAYTEAPYLFFACISLYFFNKKQYPISAIFTTFCILTRYLGALLLAIYGFTYLLRWIKKTTKDDSLLETFDISILSFLIPIAALVLLFYYFQIITGDFFVAITAHGRFADNLATPYHQFRWFFEGFYVDINPRVNPLLLMLERYIFTIPFFLLTLLLLREDIELFVYGFLFMYITLSMEGISSVASPRIMLASWVSLMALKKHASKEMTAVLAALFFFVGLWVVFKFQTGFFA